MTVYRGKIQSAPPTPGRRRRLWMFLLLWFTGLLPELILHIAAAKDAASLWNAGMVLPGLFALVPALILFAVATILGWGLYGARCAQFLFGGWKGFAAAQTAVVVLGAVLDTETVWKLSELANGLMALPNLICLAALTTELRRITKEYKNPAHLAAAGGGNYADFH